MSCISQLLRHLFAEIFGAVPTLYFHTCLCFIVNCYVYPHQTIPTWGSISTDLLMHQFELLYCSIRVEQYNNHGMNPCFCLSMGAIINIPPLFVLTNEVTLVIGNLVMNLIEPWKLTSSMCFLMHLTGCLSSYKLSCNFSKYGTSCPSPKWLCITTIGQPIWHACTQVSFLCLVSAGEFRVF